MRLIPILDFFTEVAVDISFQSPPTPDARRSPAKPVGNAPRADRPQRLLDKFGEEDIVQ